MLELRVVLRVTFEFCRGLPVDEVPSLFEDLLECVVLWVTEFWRALVSLVAEALSPFVLERVVLWVWRAFVSLVAEVVWLFEDLSKPRLGPVTKFT